MKKSISRRLDEKFKSVFRIRIASLYQSGQSGRLAKNTSKILYHPYVKQLIQEITECNPLNNNLNSL